MSDETTIAFARGLKPTPRHVLAAATPFKGVKSLAAPAEFAIVPKQLSVWGNNKYGVCVTSEEAYAKAVYSLMFNLPQNFTTEEEVINWARKRGYLNGAYLTEVMDDMNKDGLTAQDGIKYQDGGYKSVDYSDENVLQAALLIGPVKIGLDANALPTSAGQKQGWFSTQGSPYQYRNEDHCVGLSGYGSAAFLYGKLGLPLPSGLPGTTMGYLLFTWGTIGFVTHNWIMSTVAEAWVRNPTTLGLIPEPTPPGPDPVPPSPQPPVPPTPTTQLYVTIPSQTISYVGPLGRSYQLTVRGGTYPCHPAKNGAPEDDEGVSWYQVLELVRGVAPVILDGIRDGKSFEQIVADVIVAITPHKQSWTPGQWAKIIQLLLQILPLLTK